MADEVIKTRFEGDSANLVAEVEKARASVKKLNVNDLPLTTAELNKAFTASQRTASGMKGLDMATKSSGRNMLVMAQVADDAQYGMRGLANQIPQLAQAFGAGAGLAGAVSIAALVLWKLGPGLMSITGLTDGATAGVRRFNREVDTLIANFHRQTLAIGEQRAAQEALNATHAAQEAAIKKLSGGPQTAAAEREISLIKQQASHAEQLIIARTKLAQVTLPDNAAQKGRIEEVSSAQKAANDVKALEAEITRRKQLHNELGDQQAKNSTAVSNETVEIIKQKNATETLIEKLEKQLRMKKLQVDGSAAIIESLKKEGLANSKDGQIDYSNMGSIPELAYKNIKYLLKDGGSAVDLYGVEKAGKDAAAAAAEIEKKLAAAKAEAARIEQLQQKLTSGAEAANAAYAEQMRYQGQSTRELEEQLAQQRELKAITDQILKAETDKAKAAEAAAAAKFKAAEAEKAAEKAKAQGASKADFTTELQALRLQAAGREKEAEALREKARLAKEAAALAQATGISEEKALALVREKAALEKSVNDQKERGNRGTGQQNNGRIRLFKRGESATTFARAGDGLAKSVIERNVLIAENRRANDIAAQKPDTGVAILDDILNSSNRLLKVWETSLGTV